MMTAQNIKRKKRSTKIKSCNKDEIYGKKMEFFFFLVTSSLFYSFIFITVFVYFMIKLIQKCSTK